MRIDRRAFVDRLTFRFAAWLCLGAAAILLVAGLWSIQVQREHMIELVRAAADGSAETMLRSTRDAMMRGKSQEISRILAAIGAQPGVEKVRIFDKRGHVYVSTEKDEVGTPAPKSAEPCAVCHRSEVPRERLDMGERFREFRKDGRPVLGVITPIRNEADCSSAPCHAHDPSRKMLGVLDVHLSLEPVARHVAGAQLTLGAGLVFMVAAILGMAGFLTWRMVLKPLRRFKAASAQVAAGDLSAAIPVTSRDEIGEMAVLWNRMLEELRRAREELESWSKTLEERVEEKTRELELAHQRMLVVEKMASLGKLAAVVAHEINNPLTGISTYARLLGRKLAGEVGDAGSAPGGDEKTVKILALVEKEAQRCGDIVRNLLLFSRSPGARFAAVDLRPLFEQCALLLHHKAELQEVQIRQEVEPGLPSVVCDTSQIQQMVLALAMNAIEAMPRGGTLTLGARRDPTGDRVLLTVTDTGCGIAPEIRQHMFEPFFTTKEQVSGVGLGLSVVYGIVNRHHGQIEVDSARGSGTVFTIVLPRTQPRDPEEPEPASAAGPGTT